MNPPARRRGAPAAAPTLPSRGLLLSLALHATLLGFLVAPNGGPTAAADRVVAFAVQESLLQNDAPPPCAAQPATPPCEIEREEPDEPPVTTPAPELPATEPAPPTIAPPQTAVTTPTNLRSHHQPSPLQRVVCAAPRPAPAKAMPVEATATTTPAAAPSPQSSVAQPQVLVAIPGQNPTPDYPEGARRRRLEGVVIVRIEVAADGSAGDCVVLTSSGCVLLDDAALRAARRWRFQSGPGVVEQPFRFELLAKS